MQADHSEGVSFYPECKGDTLERCSKECEMIELFLDDLSVLCMEAATLREAAAVARM